MSEMAHFFVVISGSKIHERVAHFFIDIYIKNRGEEYDQFFNPLLGKIRRYKVLAAKDVYKMEKRGNTPHILA